MGDKMRNVFRSDTVFFKDLFDILGQCFDCQLEGLISFHLYKMKPFINDFLACRIDRSRSRCYKKIRI